MVCVIFKRSIQVKDVLKAELSQILSQDRDWMIESEKALFDVQTSPFDKSIVLFGAGGLGRMTLAGLRKVGIEPLAFSDNNNTLWGTVIDDVKVLSPADAAKRFGSKASFVVTIWRAGGGHRLANTRKQLHDLKCARVVSFASLFWKYSDIFLPYYALGLPHILRDQANQIEQGYDLWSDDASRSEYLSQVRFRFSLDFDGLPSPVAHDQYFPEDLFKIGEDEIFVDCGAFDGDTMKALLDVHVQSFKGEIIAFEPDPLNLKELDKFVSGLPQNIRSRVRIMPMAVGLRKELVCFSATGTAAAAVVDKSGSLQVDCASLDGVLNDIKPTFIKMDIEGGELEALMGAQTLIRNSVPILAISVYHRPDHLWKIPLLISSFSSGYRYFLRPHNEEGWDLICYAVPKNRFIG
jgi:FkbM family methyltransferase